MESQSFADKMKKLWQDMPDERLNLPDTLYLVVVGFFIGLCAGAVISVFRITTDMAFRFALAWTADHSFLHTFLWVFFALLAALIVGRLVINPAIRFGGSEWIKSALQTGQSHSWLKILAPKFIGSWLVMAFGISVGREGPSIQMGAATALGLRHFNNKQKIERRFFILGGCAAGLAGAFSAPFAGVCYVYEIMREKMSRNLFMFLISGGFGVYMACTQIFGLGFMLQFGPTPMPGIGEIWLLLPLAVFAAATGIAYNYLLRISKDAYASQKLIPPRYQPLFAFGAAAILILIFPAVNGEGLSIFELVDAGRTTLLFLCGFLVAKLFFTAYCYGASIPAGVMVPVLCVGGVAGAIYAAQMQACGLLGQEHQATCIVLGMSGAFAAAERAPVTGLVLVAQMTGAYAACLGMLLVGAVASWLARLARVKDI